MTIKGTIDYIRFSNPDNGWVAATLSQDGGPADSEIRKEQKISITGTLGDIAVGTHICAEGDFEQTKYGPTFRIREWKEERPSDIEGIRKYLASGLIKNIGPVFADAIVAAFGEQTLDILDNEPERLREVRGIGTKRIGSVIAAVREHKELREIMVWLKRYDVPNGLAVKIYKHYEGNAIDILEENPYRLADDIGGVGFKKADGVAKLLGIAPTSPFRIRSGILAVLKDAAEQGHTCLPVHELQDKACGADYLNVEPRYFSETLADPLFIDNEIIINDNEQAALPKYHYAEEYIARKTAELLSAHKTIFEDDPDTESLEKDTGFTYSDEQVGAVRAALNEGMLVITGGPGTGKTATTNAIIHELEARKKTILLAAPTGRAAKRMNEVTRRPASTIHRLLEYGQDGFGRNEDNPLDGDAVIIDETSMIDTLLMKNLLRAIRPACTLILVGDVDQLPSVGAGCVLRDLIESGQLPVVRLTKIYRQAEASRIVVNAHRINGGGMPLLDNAPGADFKFVHCENPAEISAWVTDLVCRQIKAVDGIPASDIQVLCPMRRDWDPIASTALNRTLQGMLNPDGEVALTRGEETLRVGDRIMQVRNNYDKDIFNGDTGRIVARHQPGREDGAVLRAVFDGRFLDLTKKDCEDIELAYACTIHKSQGSEYPAVVIPVHESEYIMLKRNLLYTGVTRAKKLCVLVGTPRAIATCVHQEDTARRYTALKDKLKNTTSNKQ